MNSETFFVLELGDTRMEHTSTFDTREKARKCWETEYLNRNKKDGHDGYWNSIKAKIIRKTIIREEEALN